MINATGLYLDHLLNNDSVMVVVIYYLQNKKYICITILGVIPLARKTVKTG